MVLSPSVTSADVVAPPPFTVASTLSFPVPGSLTTTFTVYWVASYLTPLRTYTPFSSVAPVGTDSLIVYVYSPVLVYLILSNTTDPSLSLLLVATNSLPASSLPLSMNSKSPALSSLPRSTFFALRSRAPSAAYSLVNATS